MLDLNTFEEIGQDPIRNFPKWQPGNFMIFEKLMLRESYNIITMFTYLLYITLGGVKFKIFNYRFQ